MPKIIKNAKITENAKKLPKLPKITENAKNHKKMPKITKKKSLKMQKITQKHRKWRKGRSSKAQLEFKGWRAPRLLVINRKRFMTFNQSHPHCIISPYSLFIHTLSDEECMLMR